MILYEHHHLAFEYLHHIITESHVFLVRDIRLCEEMVKSLVDHLLEVCTFECLLEVNHCSIIKAPHKKK